MKQTLSILILLIFFFKPYNTAAQATQPRINITGVVYDRESNMILNNLMIINKTTQQGFFAGATGSFTISLYKNDTLIIGASGFQNKKICFKDSADKPDFFVRIYMERLNVQLKEVVIIAPRDLDAIQQDIEKLGYRKEDYMLSGVDAVSSPITFLYQQFSRRERAKRHVAEMRNEDRKRELLKELLAKYVANDVIDLSDQDFDDFIDYCNVSDEFLKYSSQYEFIIYIKHKYEFYRVLRAK
ncbi:MAG: hypothetical protein ABI723_19920 [Bacteroidia bacterium]